MYRSLSTGLKAAYDDLVTAAWRSGAAAVEGSAQRREIAGRHYWYWQPATRRSPLGERGRRPPARSLGPDNQTTRRRVEALRLAAADSKNRRAIVRALKAVPLPAPTPLESAVLETLAMAEVFEAGGFCLGRPAELSYPCLLGIEPLQRRSPISASGFSLVMQEPPEIDIEVSLRRVSRQFEALKFPPQTPWGRRYRLSGTEGIFELEVFGPLSLLRDRPAYRQLLSEFDYLGENTIKAVALSRNGIPFLIPQATHYALHALISETLSGGGRQTAQKKHPSPAFLLIETLLAINRQDFAKAWDKLWAVGGARRRLLAQGYRLLPHNLRSHLQLTLAEFGDPIIWSSEQEQVIGQLTSSAAIN